MDARSKAAMTVTTSSPPASRRRKPRRRFSSVSPGSSRWNSANGLPSSPIMHRGHYRQSSLTPTSTRSKKSPVDPPFSSDAFDVEEDSFYPSESFRTAPSHRHVYHREEQRRVPLMYSSLPPTPISTSPPPHGLTPDSPLSPTSPTELQSQDVSVPPFSLWDYLREELLATDFDSHQELKWERVSNFLSIPLAMEKVRPLAYVTSKLDSNKHFDR
jgi:hypothetical protein